MTNLLAFKQASLIARASKGPFEKGVTASRLFYYDIRVHMLSNTKEGVKKGMNMRDVI
jgi:hypothetical protein